MSDGSGSENPVVRFKKGVDNLISRLWRHDSVQADCVRPTEFGRSDFPTEASEFSVSVNSTVDQYNIGSDASLITPDGIASHLRRQTIASWLIYSAYSPTHLLHMPQPTPKDLRLSRTGHFTFHNAFEDLLLLHSGQPMRNADQLSAETNMLQPSSARSSLLDETHMWTWCNELESRRLWDAYFPKRDIQHEAQSIFRKISKAQRHEQHTGQLKLSLTYLVNRAARCQEEVKMDNVVEHVASLGPLAMLGSGGEELWDAMQELEEVSHPWLKKVQPDEAEPLSAEQSSSSKGYTEEAIYQSFDSLFDDNGRHKSLPLWGSILSSLGAFTRDNNTDQHVVTSTETNTTTAADGSRNVRKTICQTSDEVSHTTVINKRLDPKGNVIEHSKTTRTTSSTYNKDRCYGADDRGDETFGDVNDKKMNNGSSGWFWAK